ncbi:tripartite tricarboxylate transporter substrate binding protein [Rhodobaculum claviforme]|uniref:ABC transporter substrate-binding protein n=1 Tax=Rhodobaculum claviforme TaxID=1549854 RepID=A0A934TKU2_9RHOB|nr:tripartite tricarboxylate transporter substrate binding protein [Rhodobaculum claviforme]MBK5927366.1 ABC transporter substrate-binding protein [Rhodobaculum claviforme]
MKSALLAAGTAVAATLAAGTALAEFPQRPLNIVVPFNAGGGTDLLMRAFAPHFEEALGGSVFVSNMAGGSGTVAASALAGQRADGHQLGYWSITIATIQPQINDVPYGVDSWTPICAVAASPTMFFVADNSPFQSMDDVVEAVRAEPGRYLYGSSGPGAITHLSMVAAFAGLGLSDHVRHLPFQGSGPAMQGMAAGTIQFFGDTELLMQGGDLRPLMVFNDERLEAHPDLPTAREVGVEAPLDELYLWGGLFAPAGLDDAVRDQLSDACGAAVASDGFQEFGARTGTVLDFMDAATFDAFFRAQYAANATLIEASGL